MQIRKIKMLKKIKVLIVAAILLTPFLLSNSKALAATSISIASPASGTTQTGSSFTVSGTATPKRTITVKVNGAGVGTTISDAGGNWSINVTGQSAGAKTVEATATGEFVYSNILNTADCSGSPAVSRMSIINTLDNTEESDFPIFDSSALAGFCPSGGFPITWKPNPAFTKAYGVAPYINSSTVFVMDLTTGALTDIFELPGTSQRGASVAYNEDGSRVYITDNANTTVYVYNTTTEAQVGGGIAVGNAPHSNTKRPGSNEIWVANSSDGTISVINTGSNTVTDTHTVGSAPNGMAFSPDGQLAYVGQGDNIEVIDADTGSVIDTIVGSNTVEYLVINSDGTRLYASHPTPGDATVDVFNLSSNTLMDTVPVANGAWGMALTNDESQLYVASPNLQGGLSGTDITVINTSDNSVAESFTPGGGTPFHIFSAPPESTTTSVSFTLSSVSSTLAETGQNQFIIAMISVTLVGATILSYKRLSQTKQ